MDREIDVVELMRGFPLFGFWRETNLQRVRRDVTAMHDLYDEVHDAPEELATVRVYVVCEDDQVDGSEFRVFVGGERVIPGLDEAWIEPGLFAHMIVKPKLGVAWPPAIKEAKQYAYSQWVPAHGFRARGVDFELHSAESRGKSPRLQLYLGVEPIAGS